MRLSSSAVSAALPGFCVLYGASAGELAAVLCYPAQYQREERTALGSFPACQEMRRDDQNHHCSDRP
jgi:hypothetical protein